VNAILIVTFGLLQLADGIITFMGLSCGKVDEVNPLLNCFADLFGLGASITVLKAVGIAFLGLMFLDRHKIENRWLTGTLCGAVAFYGWVVSNNVYLVVSA